MATAIKGSDIGRGKPAEMGGNVGDGVDEGVDVGGGIAAPEREAERGAGALGREPHGG
jgi:hypothetical protein